MAMGSLETMALSKFFSSHAASDLQVVKEVSLHQCTPENLALASVGLGHHLSEFATKWCVDDQEVTFEAFDGAVRTRADELPIEQTSLRL